MLDEIELENDRPTMTQEDDADVCIEVSPARVQRETHSAGEKDIVVRTDGMNDEGVAIVTEEEMMDFIIGLIDESMFSNCNRHVANVSDAILNVGPSFSIGPSFSASTSTSPSFDMDLNGATQTHMPLVPNNVLDIEPLSVSINARGNDNGAGEGWSDWTDESDMNDENYTAGDDKHLSDSDTSLEGEDVNATLDDLSDCECDVEDPNEKSTRIKTITGKHKNYPMLHDNPMANSGWVSKKLLDMIANRKLDVATMKKSLRYFEIMWMQGVMHALKNFMPDSSRRVCMVHLERNLKRKFGGAHLKELMWVATNAYTEWEHKGFMNLLQEESPTTYAWLVKEPKVHWCKYRSIPCTYLLP
ncbi:hypothetical protein Cgig2_010126 [Carnegiea gigantea]|uniref:Uncharacterized protein n=1 Tax=Carnegiea gigantea TaxID=171969 RepID=A0A9Q1GQ67_9CARY|nr:hypothetical protein Cgig2_010126 [Carnegiea gigantea]